MKIKLGIIGYRNQAAKLLSILENKPNVIINTIFHPDKKIDDSRFSNNFSDILDSDAVIIASPNHTHFNYIEQLLKGFSGYIFSEKPPVTSGEELAKLNSKSSNDKARIFFNFNLRFGELNEVIENNINSESMGKIMNLQIIHTHGFAFNEKYPSSWRADGEKNLHNILDAISIHYVDLLNLHFGQIKDSHYFPQLVSGKGTSFDTGHILLKYSNGVTASITNSYAAPSINEILMIGTNGFLTIRNNETTLFSPRDTFNSQGNFTSPPVLKQNTFNFEEEINNSQIRALEYFLMCVSEKRKIPIDQFQASIETNRFLIELKTSKF
jgi:predicted dehydrogenase